MGDFARVEISGVDALKARLDQLDAGMQENALRSAGYAGAKLICDQAALNAPLYTGTVAEGHPPPGTLKKSIIVKRKVEECIPYKQVYLITIRQGKPGGVDAYYAHMVENGHFVRGPGNRIKGGSRRKAEQRVALAATGARFVPPQAFMRSAFEQKKDEAVEKTNMRLGTFITLALK